MFECFILELAPTSVRATIVTYTTLYMYSLRNKSNELIYCENIEMEILAANYQLYTILTNKLVFSTSCSPISVVSMRIVSFLDGIPPQRTQICS